MVITDFDNGYTSREATGRFQITLGSRPTTTSNSVKRGATSNRCLLSCNAPVFARKQLLLGVLALQSHAQ
jgi:hypothetical protein